jgi:hypothetical protein
MQFLFGKRSLTKIIYSSFNTLSTKPKVCWWKICAPPIAEKLFQDKSTQNTEDTKDLSTSKLEAQRTNQMMELIHLFNMRNIRK